MHHEINSDRLHGTPPIDVDRYDDYYSLYWSCEINSEQFATIMRTAQAKLELHAMSDVQIQSIKDEDEVVEHLDTLSDMDLSQKITSLALSGDVILVRINAPSLNVVWEAITKGARVGVISDTKTNEAVSLLYEQTTGNVLSDRTAERLTEVMEAYNEPSD
jgi:hypothetical protein